MSASGLIAVEPNVFFSPARIAVHSFSFSAGNTARNFRKSCRMAGGMPAARHRAAFRQMATLHSLTIQNASEPFFKLPGSQLFLLSRPDGEVFGFDVSQPGLNAKFAQLILKHSRTRQECGLVIQQPPTWSRSVGREFAAEPSAKIRTADCEFPAVPLRSLN